jgi:hypothetical protein
MSGLWHCFTLLARRSETQEAFPHAARLHEAQPPAEWSLKVGDPAVRRFHLLEIKIYTKPPKT